MSAQRWITFAHDAPPILREQSFDDLATMEGEQLSRDSMSALTRLRLGDASYFLKCYFQRGKGLRRFIGRSRCRAEWEHLRLFDILGIPTAPWVLYGEKNAWPYGGVLMTRALENTLDLATIAQTRHELWRDDAWRRQVCRQVALIAQQLHAVGFIHTDLKWRNLLVTLLDEPMVYCIDCPSGAFKRGLMYQRGVVKDLACLDKLGKQHLRRKERLKFYHLYSQKARLSRFDKRRIQSILTFFDGRE